MDSMGPNSFHVVSFLLEGVAWFEMMVDTRRQVYLTQKIGVVGACVVCNLLGFTFYTFILFPPFYCDITTADIFLTTYIVGLLAFGF